VSLPLPLYVATIECDPTESADVLYVASPPLIATVPNDLLPSANIAVPVAVAGMTVAVNLTGDPNADGSADEVSVTAVVAWLTINCTVPIAVV
jgi:hypothetical protein